MKIVNVYCITCVRSAYRSIAYLDGNGDGCGIKHASSLRLSAKVDDAADALKHGEKICSI